MTMTDKTANQPLVLGTGSRKRVVAGITSEILIGAIGDSFRKLNPRTLARNPVMFVVEIVSALTTVIMIRDIVVGNGGVLFTAQLAFWLWFTVVFANFSEAVAEGRGKAQAENLRRTRTQTQAKRLAKADSRDFQKVAALDLKAGDLVLVEAGDMIPSDGDVIEGIASVDESAITGESAPVIRESGGDRSAVTGGTRVLSDWIKVKCGRRRPTRSPSTFSWRA
jgi:K+-transporting ATPase ATPase B chain